MNKERGILIAGSAKQDDEPTAQQKKVMRKVLKKEVSDSFVAALGSVLTYRACLA